MTDSINNGGPAFPHLRRYVAPDTYEPLAEGGMTLRDWFAGQIIGALISCSKDDFTIFAEENGTNSVTEISYAIADKMLEARK